MTEERGGRMAEEVLKAATVWRAVVASEGTEHKRWKRLAAILPGWRPTFAALPAADTWMPLLARFRTVLVVPSPKHNPPSAPFSSSTTPSSSSSSSFSSSSSSAISSGPEDHSDQAVSSADASAPRGQETAGVPQDQPRPSGDAPAEKQQHKPSHGEGAAASTTRLAAVELLRELVLTFLGTPPDAPFSRSARGGGAAAVLDEEQVEAYRQTVRRFVRPSAGGGGGVLDILLALMRQGEHEPIVANAAQALAHITRVVMADEQLKRELLSAPSTLLKAVKALVHRLGELVRDQKAPAHSGRMVSVVQGTMQCIRALGGTARPQCSAVEAACLALANSPHSAVRKAAAECLSVRLWCGGVQEAPTLMGQFMSTIHRSLDGYYPGEDKQASELRKSLPAPFSSAHQASSAEGSVLVMRLETLFRALRLCLSAPSKIQPTRAVSIPIHHFLELIRRVLSLSPSSPHFNNLNRTSLSLWASLPSIHRNAYRLLSSLILSVGRHLLPHYTTIKGFLVYGLERIATYQSHNKAWQSTLSALLDSISLAFPMLASCLWKDSTATILAHTLPLFMHVQTTHSALQLNALRVLGAVVRHAGPLLSDAYISDIQRAIVYATESNTLNSQECQEEARRVLLDCSLLPQSNPLLPATFRLVQQEIQRTAPLTSSSYRAEAACEVLMHPRILPRVRLAPSTVSALSLTTAPSYIVPVQPLASALTVPPAVNTSSAAPTMTVAQPAERTRLQPLHPITTTTTSASTSLSPTSLTGKRPRVEDAPPMQQAPPLPVNAVPASAAATAPSPSPLTAQAHTGTINNGNDDSMSLTASAVAAPSSGLPPLPADQPTPRPTAVEPVASVFTFVSTTSISTKDVDDTIVDIVAEGPDSSDEEENAMDEDEDREDDDNDGQGDV